MKKIILTAAFKVGHTELDSQHQCLANTVNQMIDGFNENDLPSFIAKLDLFTSKLKDHFAHEDKVIFDMGDVESEAHKNHHQSSLDYLKTVRQEINNKRDIEACILYMIDILILDMLRYDLDFGTYLKKIDYRDPAS